MDDRPRRALDADLRSLAATWSKAWLTPQQQQQQQQRIQQQQQQQHDAHSRSQQQQQQRVDVHAACERALFRLHTKSSSSSSSSSSLGADSFSGSTSSSSFSSLTSPKMESFVPRECFEPFVLALSGAGCGVDAEKCIAGAFPLPSRSHSRSTASSSPGVTITAKQHKALSRVAPHCIASLQRAAFARIIPLVSANSIATAFLSFLARQQVHGSTAVGGMSADDVAELHLLILQTVASLVGTFIPPDSAHDELMRELLQGPALFACLKVCATLENVAESTLRKDADSASLNPLSFFGVNSSKANPNAQRGLMVRNSARATLSQLVSLVMERSLRDELAFNSEEHPVTLTQSDALTLLRCICASLFESRSNSGPHSDNILSFSRPFAAELLRDAIYEHKHASRYHQWLLLSLPDFAEFLHGTLVPCFLAGLDGDKPPLATAQVDNGNIVHLTSMMIACVRSYLTISGRLLWQTSRDPSMLPSIRQPEKLREELSSLISGVVRLLDPFQPIWCNVLAMAAIAAWSAPRTTLPTSPTGSAVSEHSNKPTLVHFIEIFEPIDSSKAVDSVVLDQTPAPVLRLVHSILGYLQSSIKWQKTEIQMLLDEFDQEHTRAKINELARAPERSDDVLDRIDGSTGEVRVLQHALHFISGTVRFLSERAPSPETIGLEFVLTDILCLLYNVTGRNATFAEKSRTTGSQLDGRSIDSSLRSARVFSVDCMFALLRRRGLPSDADRIRLESSPASSHVLWAVAGVMLNSIATPEPIPLRSLFAKALVCTSQRFVFFEWCKFVSATAGARFRPQLCMDDFSAILRTALLLHVAMVQLPNGTSSTVTNSLPSQQHVLDHYDAFWAGESVQGTEFDRALRDCLRELLLNFVHRNNDESLALILALAKLVSSSQLASSHTGNDSLSLAGVDMVPLFWLRFLSMSSAPWKLYFSTVQATFRERVQSDLMLALSKQSDITGARILNRISFSCSAICRGIEQTFERTDVGLDEHAEALRNLCSLFSLTPDTVLDNCTFLKMSSVWQEMCLDTLHRIVSEFGTRLTCASWSSILEMLLAACLTNCNTTSPNYQERSQGVFVRAFQDIQLISSDYLECLDDDGNVNFLDFVRTCCCFASQTVSVNTSLTAINLLWSCGDFIASLASDTRQPPMRDTINASWLSVFHGLAEVAHSDDRYEVRSGALQSLINCLTTHGDLMFSSGGSTLWTSVVDDVMLPLLETVAATTKVKKNLVDQQPTDVDPSYMMLHHSRNTVEKQWNQTLSLIIEGVLRVFKTFFGQLAGALGVAEFAIRWGRMFELVGHASAELSTDSEVHEQASEIAVKSISHIEQLLIACASGPVEFPRMLWQSAWACLEVLFLSCTTGPKATHTNVRAVSNAPRLVEIVVHLFKRLRSHFQHNQDFVRLLDITDALFFQKDDGSSSTLNAGPTAVSMEFPCVPPRKGAVVDASMLVGPTVTVTVSSVQRTIVFDIWLEVLTMDACQDDARHRLFESVLRALASCIDYPWTPHRTMLAESSRGCTISARKIERTLPRHFLNALSTATMLIYTLIELWRSENTSPPVLLGVLPDVCKVLGTAASLRHDPVFFGFLGVDISSKSNEWIDLNEMRVTLWQQASVAFFWACQNFFHEQVQSACVPDQGTIQRLLWNEILDAVHLFLYTEPEESFLSLTDSDAASARFAESVDDISMLDFVCDSLVPACVSSGTLVQNRVLDLLCEGVVQDRIEIASATQSTIASECICRLLDIVSGLPWSRSDADDLSIPFRVKTVCRTLKLCESVFVKALGSRAVYRQGSPPPQRRSASESESETIATPSSALLISVLRALLVKPVRFEVSIAAAPEILEMGVGIRSRAHHEALIRSDTFMHSTHPLLMILFPIVCDLIGCNDGEVRNVVRDVITAVGSEVGL